MHEVKMFITVLFSIIFYSLSAVAYVGPGPGLTMLGSLWALLAGIAFALFMVVYYPIRLFIKKRAAKNKPSTDG
jgi:hypothetical protein